MNLKRKSGIFIFRPDFQKSDHRTIVGGQGRCRFFVKFSIKS